MRNTLIFIALLIVGCSKNTEEPVSYIPFGQPQKVNIIGYDDHIMEPFLSRNGNVLFFNNLNNSSVNTNIYFASKINDSVFQYNGELKGVNTSYLDAVPSMSDSNTLYFVSTRSYDQTICTVYKGVFNNDSVLDVQLVSEISKNTPYWVNFDVEISKDGIYMFFVDGFFDSSGGPYESDIIMAIKNDNIFERTDGAILENINTEALEYGACISSDLLEIYFTRVESSIPQIYLSTRSSVTEPFRKPYKIENISGFVEAPTISPDNQIIYYHKRENEKYVLYLIRKE